MPPKKHLSHEEQDAKDVQFISTSSLLRTKKDRKKKRKEPWTSQSLYLVDGVVGLSRQRTRMEYPSKSRTGGWLNFEQWSEAVALNTTEKYRTRGVGKYCDPQLAVEKMSRWMKREQERTEAYSQRSGTEIELTTMHTLSFHFHKWIQRSYWHKFGSSARQELFYQSTLDIVYDPFSSSWCPAAGCMSGRAIWPKEIRSFHKSKIPSNIYHLPYVGGISTENLEHPEVVRKLIGGYIATGVLRPWNFDWGIPTVVSPMFIIARSGVGDVIKYRLIIDYRYANGGVYGIDLELPTIKDIVWSLKRGELISKQDMKGGFHQQALHPSCYHLACIEYEDRLWYFTVTTFGWRDVPGAFQSRTAHIARVITDKFPGFKLSKVYIDDYIQRSTKLNAAEYDDMIEYIAAHGVVLSKNKCSEPNTTCEVLGLVIDTLQMRLYVSEQKSQYILANITRLIESECTSTLEVARVVGRIVSVEPAVPLLALISRPMFTDIANTLSIDEDKELAKIESERDAEDHYAWKNVALHLSDASTQALKFILSYWNIMNGQSLDKKLPNWIIRTDASQNGGGITIWSVDKDGSMKLVKKLFIFLSADERLTSSTARESTVFARGVSVLDEEMLRDKLVEGVVDNRGLVLRHYRGSSILDIQRNLYSIAVHLITCGAIWRGMWWARRCLMQAEDDISKEQFLDIAICTSWYKSMMEGQRSKPNVDVFASKSNAVTQRYATIDPDESATSELTYYDGMRYTYTSKDIAWIFPPVELLPRAFKRWKESRCLTAYFCIPLRDSGEPQNSARSVTESPFVERFWSDAPVIVSPREAANNGKWRHSVYCLRKGKEGSQGAMGFTTTNRKLPL